jgi:lipopolysaccharide biosynthesis glycosyltransferase
MKHAIVVTFAANYFPLFEIFYKSLKRSFPDHPDFYIFHQGIEADKLKPYEKDPKVRLIDFSSDQFEFGPSMRHSDKFDARLFYRRFVIWTDFFEAYNNVLYLDIDSLVVGSLNELFENIEFTIFEEAYTENDQIFYDHKDPELLKLLKEDQINSLPKRTANAGLFVVPKKYRTEEHFKQLSHIMRRYQKHIIWADQSVLNLWMIQNNISVTKDYRFNYQLRRLFFEKTEKKAYRDVRFLHYNGMYYLSNVLLFLIQTAYVSFSYPPLGRWLYKQHFIFLVRHYARLKKIVIPIAKIENTLFKLANRLGF